jgi:hypothetical protein
VRTTCQAGGQPPNIEAKCQTWGTNNEYGAQRPKIGAKSETWKEKGVRWICEYGWEEGLGKAVQELKGAFEINI